MNLSRRSLLLALPAALVGKALPTREKWRTYPMKKWPPILAGVEWVEVPFYSSAAPSLCVPTRYKGAGA